MLASMLRRHNRLALRLSQLYLGLWLYGLAAALQVRSRLGLDPWDVFHQGIAGHVGLAIGTVVILVGAAVLLLWIPLRQWPGIGTVSNAILIGIAMNVSLQMLPHIEAMPWRVAEMITGIGLCGIATGMYIGARFGPGPRDGLMTGLARRTGVSIRATRTGIELTVLAGGWALGGTVGIGTVAYALAIGPLAQLFLRVFDRGDSVVVGGLAGEPGREAVDGHLEVGIGVDEGLQPVSEPLDAHLLAAATLGELLDPAVGEVHP
jgi:uncharacterized membrane protein YczE